MTGKGTRVDVSMLDSTISLLEHGVMEYVATGKPLGRLGNRHPYIAPFDTFMAKDCEFVICAGDDELFARLCQTIGRPQLVNDERFASNEKRTANQEALKRSIEEALVSNVSDYWVERITKAGVPCGRIEDISEAFESPQLKARNMVIVSGGLRMPGNPMKLDGFPDPIERRPAPGLDSEGEGIRREFRPKKAIGEQ